MSTFDDLDGAAEKAATAKTDTESLLAKLAVIRSALPPGMFPDKEAALDAAISQANGWLGEIDAKVT